MITVASLARLGTAAICVSFLSSALTACGHEGPKTPSSAQTSQGARILCDVRGEEVLLGKKSLVMAGHRKLSPEPELSAQLQTETEGKPGAQLLIRADETTKTYQILRVALSATSAGLEVVSLEVPGLNGTTVEVELALPDSERAPSLALSDAYISLESGRAVLGWELDSLGLSEREVKEAQLSSAGSEEASELTGWLTEECQAGKACKHAVVRLGLETPFLHLTPLLAALYEVQGGRGTVRLMVDESSAQAEQGEPSASKLPLASVREVVTSYQEDLVRCHQGGAEKEEARGGTVVVEFVVTPLGIVFDASANAEVSTLKDPEILGCVVDTFTRMKFPKPESNSVQSYTVRF